MLNRRKSSINLRQEIRAVESHPEQQSSKGAQLCFLHRPKRSLFRCCRRHLPPSHPSAVVSSADGRRSGSRCSNALTQAEASPDTAGSAVPARNVGAGRPALIADFIAGPFGC